MFVFYHALVLLFLPGILALLLIKLVRRRDYLRNFSERFGKFDATDTGEKRCPPGARLEEVKASFQPRFWLHAVSAGEVTAGMPLLAALRERYPECYIAISTSTPAGRAILETSKITVDRIFYFPVDLAWVVRRVVATISPTMLVLVETDLWPALLKCLARRRIPVVLVNGRISQRRVKFRWLFRPVFGLLNHICVQTKVDAERLVGIGVSSAKISITGNLKFAQALSQLEAPPVRDEQYRLPPGAALLIGGSTHPGEEEELLDCYRKLREQKQAVFLMIAPRHLERLASIEALIHRRGYAPQHWSRFGAWQPDRITLLDSVGNLARLYSLAQFVFVGGSFVKRGGHNILEPAAWGKPIFFGPHMENYSSIAETVEREGAAIRVASGAELAEHIERLIGDPRRALEMGRRAIALVRSNQGVVERNLAVIETLFRPEPSPVQTHSISSEAVSKAVAMVLALSWL